MGEECDQRKTKSTLPLGGVQQLGMSMWTTKSTLPLFFVFLAPYSFEFISNVFLSQQSTNSIFVMNFHPSEQVPILAATCNNFIFI